MPGATLSAPPQQEHPVQGEEDNHSRHENAPFWYSFDYGSVHFVMISTEHDVTPGSHQYRVGGLSQQVSVCIYGWPDALDTLAFMLGQAPCLAKHLVFMKGGFCVMLWNCKGRAAAIKLYP